MSILENPIPNEVLDNATSPLTDDRAEYKDSTYEIVSKVAYLIGVPKRIFDNEHEAPKVEVYNRLDSDKTARIIRHLCIVRTAIERNFKRINERMRFQYETILSMPEYVPQESINQLSLDGVNFIKNTSKKLCQHVVEINRLICDRTTTISPNIAKSQMQGVISKEVFMSLLRAAKRPLSLSIVKTLIPTSCVLSSYRTAEDEDLRSNDSCSVTSHEHH